MTISHTLFVCIFSGWYPSCGISRAKFHKRKKDYHRNWEYIRYYNLILENQIIRWLRSNLLSIGRSFLYSFIFYYIKFFGYSETELLDRIFFLLGFVASKRTCEFFIKLYYLRDYYSDLFADLNLIIMGSLLSYYFFSGDLRDF